LRLQLTEDTFKLSEHAWLLRSVSSTATATVSSATISEPSESHIVVWEFLTSVVLYILLFCRSSSFLQLLVLLNSKISLKQSLDATAHKRKPAGCRHHRPRPLRASLSPILSALSLIFLTTTQKLDFLKSKSNC
jgi:hypothetical protein